GGGRDDAALPLLLGEAGDAHVGAADLERAGPLQVLAFEVDAGQGGIARGFERRAAHDRFEFGGGRADLGEGNELVHASDRSQRPAARRAPARRSPKALGRESGSVGTQWNRKTSSENGRRIRFL